MDIPTGPLKKTMQTWIVYIFGDTAGYVNRGDIRKKIFIFRQSLSLLLGKVLPVTPGHVPDMQPCILARLNVGAFEVVLP